MSRADTEGMTQAQKIAIANKDAILRAFCPTFCFSKGEYSFPMDPDQYAQDVLSAKMRHYAKLTESRALTEEEKKEYSLVKKFYPKGIGKDFNREAFKDTEVIARLAHEKDNRDKVAEENPTGLFLTFEEKKLGYKLGEMVPISGVKPKDGYVDAPVHVDYMPTHDGALIKAECFYPLSGAIPGTNWLYKLLPDKWAKKLGNLAVHAGDWEGVYVKVKIDEQGNTKFDHMRTFAHGRSGSVERGPDRTTFDENGAPCVFVGEATHPSYADNFPVRSKFFDKVGNATRLDVRKGGKITDLSDGENHPEWTVAKHWGTSGMEFSKHKTITPEVYESKRADKNDGFDKFGYKPISDNKFFQKINSAARTIQNFVRTKVLGKKPVEIPSPVMLESLNEAGTSRIMSRVAPGKTVDTPTLSRGAVQNPLPRPKKSFLEKVQEQKAARPKKSLGKS